MEQIKYYFELYKKQIILSLSITIILTLACISFFLINNKYNNDEIALEKNSDIALIEDNNSKEEASKIKVDIKGCIANPGVYELDENKRVIDVIELAGGLTKNAHTESLNLSQKLNDEDVIIIYSKEEYKENTTNNSNNISSNNKSSVITKKTETKTTSSSKTTNNKTNSANGNESLNTIVNINTASKETLMTLNGIGESKANKIIEYRNTNGSFKSTEELKNVNGIGDAIYAKIKDKITI